ncbi:hypothetical protein [Chryseobacterium daeguense]|uniref:hypothetical protein n=1 Tax=Chryseobacterium daeguense TaxID=412438 RepID=UPI000428CD12|nr:hypothetical protein [Chryseobacterium daeguense]
MKKFIWISLVVIFVVSCGSRKRQMTKESEKTESEIKASGEVKTDSNSQTESFTSLSQFLANNSLKITSNGTPYQLQYGSLIFSGDADVEFSEKNEQIEYVYRYFNHTTYITETTYKTETKYQSQKDSKKVDVERKGVTFGAMIWIVLISMILGFFLINWLKSYLPKWRINLFNKK